MGTALEHLGSIDWASYGLFAAVVLSGFVALLMLAQVAYLKEELTANDMGIWWIVAIMLSVLLGGPISLAIFRWLWEEPSMWPKAVDLVVNNRGIDGAVNDVAWIITRAGLFSLFLTALVFPMWLVGSLTLAYGTWRYRATEEERIALIARALKQVPEPGAPPPRIALEPEKFNKSGLTRARQLIDDWNAQVAAQRRLALKPNGAAPVDSAPEQAPPPVPSVPPKEWAFRPEPPGGH